MTQSLLPATEGAPLRPADCVHTPPQRAFFPALDGLRAIAFLLVFGLHYLFFPWGHTGVIIFFVLSGFLITGILLDTTYAPHRFRSFYVRRTLRIFPLYYAALLVPAVIFRHYPVFFLWPLYLGNFLRDLGPQFTIDPLVNITDLHVLVPHLRVGPLNFGHFWTLCVEEQFYLVWPTVVYLLRRRTVLIAICVGAVVLDPLARAYGLAHLPLWMLNADVLARATPFVVDGLLLGALLAILWRGAHRQTLLSIGRILFPVMGSFALVYLAVTTWQSLHDPAVRQLHPGLIPYRYGSWSFTWTMSYINIFGGAALLCCLQPGTWLYRAMMLRPLRWMGRISYGLYVFHDIIHWPALLSAAFLLRHTRHDTLVTENLLAAALALVTTCCLASLSYRFFESPLLRLKERWAPR